VHQEDDSASVTRGSPRSGRNVRERVPLLAIPPPDQDREPYLQSRQVDHGSESLSQVENWPVASISIVQWDNTG
jgi:hypothetical protein